MKKKGIDPVGIFIELSKKNNYKKSLVAFEKLLLNDPLNTRLLFQLGNVHSIIGKNPKKAIEVFDHILNLEPNNLSARNNMAVCLMESKQFSAAVKEFSVVLKSEYNALIYKQRAYCFEKLKKYGRCVDDLNKCVSILESQAK